MDYKVNILFELLFTGIQFLTLWMLFYLLYRPESKIRRIGLLCFMLLWRPLHIIAFVLTFPIPVKILLQGAAFLVLMLLSEGKKKNKLITALYLWNIGLLIDAVTSCFITGLTGTLAVSNMNTLYLEMTITDTVMLFWAVFYYLLMRSLSLSALERIPFRLWLITVLTPLLGAAALLGVFNPLKTQLEAGFNNFLFCGVFGFVIFLLDLCIFYLYIKLISSHHSRLLAGELAQIPPLYSPASGLSLEFIEKYNLSKRQTEITEALLQGKSNKEIALAYDIEVNTVQVHLQNVYRKTDAPGRYALMALVGMGITTA
ncbi:MAG: helix-turn-helix transcriptional regulator [Spirochaetaceae bacterium]|nr:helix-turn-helix transcriptional regulator [Spirochaetaceae bacterium]